MESRREKEYKAVADRAEASRKKASEMLEKLEKTSGEPSPMQLGVLSVLQEQAKIDALHMISYDIAFVQDAIESQ